MRRIVTLLMLTAFLYSTGISAHEGMIALYADPSASSCQAILPELTMINLSLFYIRGDGPYMANVCQFRLLKSNDDIQIGMQFFDESLGIVICIGTLERASGIAIAYHAGELGWCFEEDYVFLGTIPIANISDPDTFTISVVPIITQYEFMNTVAVVNCNDYNDVHEVLGGTFVFNGTCEKPENPFGSSISMQSSTWGAIKSMYR